MTEGERYGNARARVREIKSFYVHGLTYLLVNTGLFILDVLTPGGWWFYWPLMGWGFGLAAHGAGVFWFPSLLGNEWEERKIRELMEKEQETGNENPSPSGGRSE